MNTPAIDAQDKDMSIAVTINAMIMPHIWDMNYGGENPRIFQGSFEISLPKIPLLPNYHETAEKVIAGGLILHVQRRRKGSEDKIIWDCSAHLESVTIEYFSTLAQAGWSLNEDGAKMKGYPNDDKDARLQEETLKIQRHHEEMHERFNLCHCIGSNAPGSFVRIVLTRGPSAPTELHMSDTHAVGATKSRHLSEF